MFAYKRQASDVRKNRWTLNHPVWNGAYLSKAYWCNRHNGADWHEIAGKWRHNPKRKRNESLARNWRKMEVKSEHRSCTELWTNFIYVMIACIMPLLNISVSLNYCLLIEYCAKLYTAYHIIFETLSLTKFNDMGLLFHMLYNCTVAH